MSSLYGSLVTDTEVERRVLAHLQGWLPSYVLEANRQDGELAEVALPKSYEVVRDPALARWNEQALPAVVVQIGGTLTTTRQGAKYRVVYSCQVAAIVAGQTRSNTRVLAGVYATAITGALCQHGDLSGFADGVEWADTTYDLIAEERSRTLMAAIVSLDVAVNNVLDVSLGPAVMPPIDDPTEGLPGWGNADEVDTTVVLIPIGVPFP